MTQPLHIELDAPGPWTLHQVGGCEVYMRAVEGAARVSIRCRQGGAISDLGVACDLDRRSAARIVVNPHQDTWTKTAAARQDLLERALAVWRRHGAGEPPAVVTRQAGAHVYEFWADQSAPRVEITRRAMHPETVIIDEHLGYGDQLDATTAEIRLRERVTIPAQLLLQVQTLVREAWQRAALADADGGAR